MTSEMDHIANTVIPVLASIAECKWSTECSGYLIINYFNWMGIYDAHYIFEYFILILT